MSVKVYVEGGGDRAELKTRCREGFSKLIDKAGFAGRMPGVVACGSRNAAFDRFQTALRSARGDDYPILLVDSEDPIADANRPDADASGAWRHLAQRDGWARPDGVADDQAQLMVTAMETWLLADRQALAAYFPGMNTNALLPDTALEDRRKEDVLQALEDAARPSSKGGYAKGRDAFALLAQADPATLGSRLPHFRRFVAALEARSLLE